MTYGRVAVGSALAITIAVSVACNRDTATSTEVDRTEMETAVQQDERDDTIAELRERVAELEREHVDASQTVARGEATATAGLREALKEDVQSVREAVDNLGTTTPDNWWDRHEEAMNHAVEDIEADVRRLAGSLPEPDARPTATSGTTGAPFTSRRDAFVQNLQARVDAMEQAVADFEASGARETELEDVRARVDKLDEDIDRLRSASPDDWWDLSKARVTEYVERVEGSVDRLDENEG